MDCLFIVQRRLGWFCDLAMLIRIVGLRELSPFVSSKSVDNFGIVSVMH